MRSKSVFLFAALLVAATFVSTAVAQNSGDSATVAEITRLTHEGSKATLANDSAYVKQYYAEDYSAGSSWGNWDTKASTLQDMSDTKANKPKKDEISDLKVRAYGNTASRTTSQCVAPKAMAASLSDAGAAKKTSREIVVMNGTIIIARIIPAVKTPTPYAGPLKKGRNPSEWIKNG